MLGTLSAIFKGKAGALVLTVLLLVAGMYVFTATATVDSWTEGGIGLAHGWDGRGTLSDTDYATSWISNADSEDITYQGEFMIDETFTFHQPTKYYYVAELNGAQLARYPSTGYIDDIPQHLVWVRDKWYNLDVWTFNVKGEVVGQLKVYTVMHLDGGFLYDNWEDEFGWDGAYLHSGRGEIFAYGDKGPFEEGEAAQIFVRTGFTNGNGWTVKLYPPADRTDLSTQTLKTLADDDEDIISITVQSGWFKEGSTNEFRVELWNHLFSVGFDHFFSIDDRELAPGTPTITKSWTGSTATFQISSVATYKDIDKFVVWAWYGGRTKPSLDDGESWILYSKDYPATATIDGDTFTTTVTIEAKNKDGNVVIEVVARDPDGRNSGPAIAQLIVENGGFDDTDDDFEQPFIFSVLVGVLMIIGIILGFAIALMLYKGGQKPTTALVVAIIIATIFIIAAVIVGYTPDMALLLGYWSELMIL